ncbi:MAG: hypothetical protein H6502_00245 [Candidatus Woesearchaeota archaeon]|nr:MAG: hypothetical protein H6502_00245 [Candidatus Woesearchaeota archaeon]
MKRIVAKEIPLGELTLRKYEHPTESMSERDIVRKLCLSLGLLQPGDSRDVVVDVLLVLLKHKEPMTSISIERATIDMREAHHLPVFGVAPSNIRRQLLRLRDVFLVEKVNNLYRLTENALFEEIFNEKIKKYYLTSLLSRIEEYVKLVDKTFLKKKEEKQ